MSIRRAILFLPNGKGSPTLFSQWRTKGPLKPIQTSNYLHDDGAPTRYFAQLWREAFPARRPLPARIANPDGTGTEAFWDVFG